MKKIVLFALLLPFLGNAQNHLDLFKIGFSQTSNADFEDFDTATDIRSLDIDVTVPLQINDKNAFITGVLYSRNRLNLFPGNTGNPEISFGSLAETTSLYTTILKLGLAHNFNDKLSATFVALPKLASDYRDISGDDFFIGGVALFKYKKSEHTTYKFGWFAMQQTYGIFTTPIVGLYYMSPSQKFEADVSFPIAADLNYKLNNTMKVGFDYFAIGRSFDIHKPEAAAVYVDYTALEFTTYYQYGLLDNSVLLRAKIGYATSNFEVYNDGDNIDARFIGFNIGDNRTQVNPIIGGGVFAKLEAVYRFDLSKKE